MQNRLRNFLRAPIFKEDVDKTRIASLLSRIMQFLILSLGVAMVGSLWAEGVAVAWSILGAMIVVVLIGLVLLHAGYVQPVAQALVLFLWITVVIVVALSGELKNPETVGLVIVVLMAGLLTGRSSMIAYAILSAIAAAGIYILETNGMLPMLLVIDETVSLIIVISNVILAAGLLHLALENLSQAMESARTSEMQLAVRNRELFAFSESLEAQVQERTQNTEAARQEAEAVRQALEEQAWQANALAELTQATSGEKELPTLAEDVIRQLCLALNAQMGALFLLDDEMLRLAGSYAYTYRKTLSNQFRPGEGLVGQAALEKKPIIIQHLPDNYLVIQTGLVEATPRHILAAPFLFDEKVMGVVECATLDVFTPSQLELLGKALNNIGVIFYTAQNRARINNLLAQTQQQAMELSLREEELRATNDELQEQTRALRASQQRLVAQQQDLENANAELEEKATILQEQRSILDQQNQELKTAQETLQQKAEELAQASKYKSEFLANMSHELRTPLNSLLILARMLADNEAGNLSEDQVDSARIIYQSGSDLLMLINDILDLAKVEAGRMLFHFEPVAFSSIIQALHAQFDPLAEEHGLTFQTEVAEDVPATIINDQQRLLQVLKNLLSNAFKFTSQGSVRLVIEHPAPLYDLSPLACSAGEAVALRVIDTGIGMTIEQQQVVFEAFQQADGSTSRRYGGTGLGLTISREMITHLGGKLTLQSEYGKGSTFTIYLPLQPLGLVEQQEAAPTAAPEFTLPPALEPARQAAPSFVDDRATLRRGDRVLLLIEDDPAFARVIYDYAHNKGFKCLMAEDGESGLDMVKTYLPDAVILDLRLPGINGWQVLESIKKNASTRHIPVHILSAEEENIDAYKLGAIGFLTKPITLEDLETVFQKIEAIVSGGIKNLLVVEDDSALRHSIRQLLDGSDVQISEAAHGQAALEMLQAHPFDCMILDLNLPDMTGFELLNQINADPNIPRSPIIVYTGKAITEEENAEIMKYADSVIIKGAKSPERLLDETALFLHRVASDISNEKQALGNAPDRDAVFIGKHILVVDDEMRNAFALSRLLTSKGLKVSIARNGLKALEILESSDKIDLVLLDMMMPEMDGYETLHHLRSQPRFNNLPILALTAKAMKGDQEKCINAGASDYLAKPIDADRLFSMLRVWLYA